MRKYETWNDVPETSFSKTELTVDNHGRKIWGKIWLPEDGKEKHPLIIVSHGLGANYLSLSRYAKVLAGHGFACYLFDFRGGGGSHSDGTMLEMSVLTEISDLLGTTVTVGIMLTVVMSLNYATVTATLRYKD
ncbi:MAG: acetylxylan esterase, partial [Erysipelotrichaceae bacterium]|nr:acetylxylan esterase [Erysipelotrichaceae bacterium]